MGMDKKRLKVRSLYITPAIKSAAFKTATFFISILALNLRFLNHAANKQNNADRALEQAVLISE